MLLSLLLNFTTLVIIFWEEGSRGGVCGDARYIHPDPGKDAVVDLYAESVACCGRNLLTLLCKDIPSYSISCLGVVHVLLSFLWHIGYSYICVYGHVRLVSL